MYSIGLVDREAGFWGRLQEVGRSLVLVSCFGLFAYGIVLFAFNHTRTETMADKVLTLGVGVVLLAIAMVFGTRLKLALHRLASPERGLSGYQWIGLCFVVGLSLRLAWLWLADFPVFQDSWVLERAFLFATEGILQFEGEHELGVTYAFYPPGSDLLLAPLSLLLGTQTWVLIVVNAFLFLGYLVVVYSLSEKIFDAATARVATLLLVFWPNHIFGIAIIKKEQFLMLIIPLIIFLYIHVVRINNGKNIQIARILFLGFLVGLSILMQPSSLFFISVLIAADLMCRRLSLIDLKRWLIMAVVALSVVAPWSLRNYYVLGEFVPLTTGGAYALYVSNNPDSTGGWMPLADMTELHHQGVGEVEGARIARERAVDWITSNPMDFLMLIPHKMRRLMAADGEFFYAAITLGLGMEDWRRDWMRMGVNVYWLFIMMLFVSSFSQRRNWETFSSYPVVLALLGMLYFAAISAVFEGSARHHFAAVMALVPIAAVAVCRKRDEPPGTASGPAGGGDRGRLGQLTHGEKAVSLG